jgi:PAS domain S-box-containing protein
MFRVDERNRIVEYYAAEADELLVSPELFLGKTFSDVLPPDLGPPFDARINECREGRERQKFEYLLNLDKLGPNHFEARMTRCGTREVLIIIRNITEQRRFYEALKASEHLNRTLVESFTGGLVHVNADGTFKSVNRFAQEVLGIHDGQGGRDSVEAFNPETIYEDGRPFPASEYPISKALATGKPAGPTMIGVRQRNGGMFWGMFIAAPLFEDSSGKPTGGVVTFFDISENKKLEEQLRQSQKMETVGHLAGGIAHDFNNLLCAIIGYAQLSKKEARQSNLRREHLCDMLDEVLRCGHKAEQLTRGLLAFSRKQVLEMKVLHLGDEVADFSKMLRRLIDEHIEITIRTQPSLGSVRADPSQISQVMMNLALNARDAMPLGGRLVFETSNVELAAADLRDEVGMAPGSYVLLAVSDTGEGMSEETRARAFEPFFTTKERGKGTGLGLAMVYGIVKQHNGIIRLHSSAKSGTRFELFFPRVPERIEVAAVDAEVERRRPTGTQTILLVEDEEQVRNFVKIVLNAQGYEVVPAGNAEEALRIAAGPDCPKLDLLLTDVIMPGMNGSELHEKLLAQRPGLRAIQMTGYSEDHISNQGLLRPGALLLRKPFSIETLLDKVEQALDSSSPDSSSIDQKA